MRLPTVAQLERAGNDAAAVLEAHIGALEDLAARGANPEARSAGRRMLARANMRWEEFFGPDETQQGVPS